MAKKRVSTKQPELADGEWGDKVPKAVASPRQSVNSACQAEGPPVLQAAEPRDESAARSRSKQSGFRHLVARSAADVAVEPSVLLCRVSTRAAARPPADAGRGVSHLSQDIRRADSADIHAIPPRDGDLPRAERLRKRGCDRHPNHSRVETHVCGRRHNHNRQALRVSDGGIANVSPDDGPLPHHHRTSPSKGTFLVTGSPFIRS